MSAEDNGLAIRPPEGRVSARMPVVFIARAAMFLQSAVPKNPPTSAYIPKYHTNALEISRT
jgi:hypothetical protein